MLKSMTAYGRACLETPLGRFNAEIQSVNRKHLEINIFLPQELTRFESDLRKLLGTVISRGQVTLKVSAYFEQGTPIVIKANLPLARQAKKAWETIAADLGLKEEFKLAMLANEPGVLIHEEELQDEEQYLELLKEVVNQALSNFMTMREIEGKALQQDIAERIVNLKNWIEKIVVRSPGATERYRQKLTERLKEVCSGAVENEERVLREVAVYAERIDIAEEATRFRSHLNQVEELLKSDVPIGKTFEFLLQELNREINTIGSKASDVEVTRLVVEIKSELERIREQIQNIE